MGETILMTKTSATYSGPQPGSSEQTQGIIETLRTLYPHARYDLTFANPLELFVATQLAAQCPDERVNAVTKDLFQKYRRAQDYAEVSQEELEQDIKPTGFYRKKAQQIRAACHYLVTHYEGEVPQTMAQMVTIPGIGRKTANVILGNAFGITEGFIVDTHVQRLAPSFCWTHHKDAVNIEQEPMRMIPRPERLYLAHRMIAHGRATRTAP